MSALSSTPGNGWVARSLARTAALLPRREDWSHARPGRDLMAGLMVGLVALPLALGFGVSSGMGAGAGLVTAVVAGALAAIFGGSRVQVSGPTGAMTVVLVPIIATHGADGVLVVGLLAGLILIGLGYAGTGRFIRYVPIPVVEGFTVGIALIIGLQQLPAALGVQVHAENAALDLGPARVSNIPAGLPTPSLPTGPLADLEALVLPAVAVAALAALESLLSATVADGMSIGQRHDSDRELVGQGLANLGAPLFGGIPVGGADPAGRAGRRTHRDGRAHGAEEPSLCTPLEWSTNRRGEWSDLAIAVASPCREVGTTPRRCR